MNRAFCYCLFYSYGGNNDDIESSSLEVVSDAKNVNFITSGAEYQVLTCPTLEQNLQRQFVCVCMLLQRPGHSVQALILNVIFTRDF